MANEQQKYLAFGDESEFDGVVVYGIACIPTQAADQLEQALLRLKRAKQIPDKERVHCSVMLSWDARKRTAWNGLDSSVILSFLEDMCRVLVDGEMQFSVGAVDRKSYPQHLPAPAGESEVKTAQSCSLHSRSAQPLWD